MMTRLTEPTSPAAAAPASAREKEAFPNDLFTAYENGKHRRYTMLFAVNGGAFAVLQFLTHPDTRYAKLLEIPTVAWLMIAFTIVMAVDIFAFGCAMRRHWVNSWPAAERERKRSLKWEGLFSGFGMIVAAVLPTIIVIAWLLVI